MSETAKWLWMLVIFFILWTAMGLASGSLEVR